MFNKKSVFSLFAYFYSNFSKIKKLKLIVMIEIKLVEVSIDYGLVDDPRIFKIGGL